MYSLTFKSDSASAQLVMISSEYAKILAVRSEDRGRGHANALMQKIVEYADDNNLTLTLTVRAYGGPRGILSNKELESFYGKFGFERIFLYSRPVEMMRLPSQEIHTL